MVRYHITHRTTYQYASQVSHCHNEAQITPRRTATQTPIDTRITVSPRPAMTSARDDYFGNRVFYFAVQEAHQMLEILSENVIDIMEPSGPSGREPVLPSSMPWEEVRAAANRTWDVRDFLMEASHVATGPDFADFASDCFTPGRPFLEAVWALNLKINNEIAYVPGSTNVSTSTFDVLRERRGVCQDFTHLALACMRSLGLPARYVSGYIESNRSGGRPHLQGADASHAWFGAWNPEIGWLDFDPTNKSMPYDQHITVSYGRDYADISPLRGIVFGGGKSVCRVEVSVQRQVASMSNS